MFINDDDGGNAYDNIPNQGETHVRNIRICEPDTDYQYHWEVDDGSGFTLVSNEPTLKRSLDIDDVVRLTVVDANGRTTTATYTVS